MAVTTTKTNKPINPRGNDQSPKGYNRAALYSGKALDFDGVNDTINVGRPSYMNISNGAITLACYARLDSTAANGHFFRQENGAQRILFAYQSGLDGLAFGTYNGSYSELDVAFEPSEKSAITNGICFVVATQDTAGNRSIYLNGVLIGSDTKTQGLTCSNSADLHIGSNQNVEVWNGLIGNAKIFDVALTPAQVSDLYNNPEKIVPTGVEDTALKLWLPMMEGAGTTAYDGSSTANDPDLIVNGDFATDSDWTKGTGWTIANGVATHDSSLGPGDLYQDFNLTIGKSYKITIEITATDTTELYFMTDGGDYVEVTGSPIGVHSHVFVADESSHRVGVRGSGNWDGSVDNIKLEGLNFANHGTISGATWTHGIGSPVAQSAVMDWNKGGNLALYSEEFENAYYGINNVSKSANQTTAPDGTQTADKITATLLNDHYIWNTSIALSGQNTISVFAKYNGYNIGLRPQGIGSGQAFTNFDLQNGTILGSGGTSYNDSSITSFGNGWYRCSLTLTNVAAYGFGVYMVNGTTATELPHFTADGTSGHYVWGMQANAGATLTPYVRTGATAQTSPVLLPQGLTSGRDITGVNLFENVRKQGALNLDGNSWAEVHDNASLDITGHITLEAWAQIKDGMVADGILGRWSSSAGYLLYLNGSTDIRFYIDGLDARYTSLTNGWHHFVGVYDGSAKRLYIDGVQVSSTSQTTGAAASTAPIEIGRYQQSTGNTFDGPIAQPRIYNRALTAEEVLRNYNSEKNTYQ